MTSSRPLPAQVLNLLENGQFEIVGGGWVMNDEANSHYFAILEQMITGHEWLKLNLNGYKPKYVLERLMTMTPLEVTCLIPLELPTCILPTTFPSSVTVGLSTRSGCPPRWPTCRSAWALTPSRSRGRTTQSRSTWPRKRIWSLSGGSIGVRTQKTSQKFFILKMTSSKKSSEEKTLSKKYGTP